jgi:hypothetical protein
MAAQQVMGPASRAPLMAALEGLHP